MRGVGVRSPISAKRTRRLVERRARRVHEALKLNLAGGRRLRVVYDDGDVAAAVASSNPQSQERTPAVRMQLADRRSV